MAISLWRGLRRVAQVFRFNPGATLDERQLDAGQLKTAYREVVYVRPVVDLAAAFIFGGGFESASDDERAAAALGRFWPAQENALLQAGREFALFGNTYLAFEWDAAAGEAKMRVLPPESVSFERDPERPWLVKRVAIRVSYDRKRVEQEISAEEYTIRVDGRVTQSGRNPYGLIPVVHVPNVRFSDELFGTGELDPALFSTLQQYQRTRDKGVKIEDYHGSPWLVATGVTDIEPLKSDLESGKPAEVGFGFALPKDATLSFLETTRGATDKVELLKMLYHGAVVQSRTPEFLLAVGMPAAQASTKEQRAPWERKVTLMRAAWAPALIEANRVVLRLLAAHRVERYSTEATEIRWGVIFEKDRREEAESRRIEVSTLTDAAGAGAISMKTVREHLPELVPDPAEEERRVAAERAELDELRHEEPAEGEEETTDEVR
jgi:hypothetical protein